MQIDHPYHLDGLGRTATASEDDHLRDLIEQVLFTTPGERVHRPTFGSGVMQLVFGPASGELTATAHMLVGSALHEWLGDRIQVEAVDVQVEDTTVSIVVTFIVLRTRHRQTTRITREMSP